MRRVLKLIDSISEFVGQQLRYVVLFLVLVICAEVVMRYGLNRPTIQLPVIQTWTGTVLYVLAFSYVHLHKGHVRVDVLYARFADRWKAVVDSILWFVFFLPAIGVLIYTGYEWAEYALRTGERSTITYWYPPTAPIRIVVLTGLVLFFLQGFATLIRDLYFAVRNQPYD